LLASGRHTFTLSFQLDCKEDGLFDVYDADCHKIE
jgi:hypothetical protein